MCINMLTIHDIDDLNIILDSSFLITGDRARQNEEIAENMWVISINEEDREKILPNQLVDFLFVLINKRIDQMSKGGTIYPVVFYMWFDEMAAQLRLNMISDFGKQLPFGCNIEIIDSPEPIIKDFLASDYHQGISWDELSEMDDVVDEDDNLLFVLKVFVARIA